MIPYLYLIVLVVRYTFPVSSMNISVHFGSLLMEKLESRLGSCSVTEEDTPNTSSDSLKGMYVIKRPSMA